MAIQRIADLIKQRTSSSAGRSEAMDVIYAPRRLGERLLNEQVIDERELRLALERQGESGGFLGEVIASLGFATSGTVGKFLSELTGFEFIDLVDYDIDLRIARQIDEEFARRRKALPISEANDIVTVAMVDPLDVEVVDDLRARLKRPVEPVLAFGFDLEQATNRVFSVQSRSESIIEELSEGGPSYSEESSEDLLMEAGEGPIVRLVQNILEGAMRQGASDIHIEPSESSVRVRYRVDGLLFDQMTLPRANHAAVISRLKIVSHLNIAERRRPQDGRFVAKNEVGDTYDVRVSIINTVFGEKIVMRMLEKSSSIAVIEKLGFLPSQQEQFEAFVKRPHGVILITGPTGSGKSTSMFAGLSRINDPTINISTIEDPVEYHMPGANQISVNQKIGLSFASGLRTLVRQDPDVIMVGEIRDSETAEIAIQAALTGHLVLSTMHTNNAAGAVVRLQNMGIEGYLVASAVIGVVGQRLLRTICPSCKAWHSADEDWIREFNLPITDGRAPQVAYGKGCSRCNGRGMRGRTAACEIMPITEGIRSTILERGSTSAVVERARSEGMITMRQSAIRKLLEGITTPEEIVRVLYNEDEDCA